MKMFVDVASVYLHRGYVDFRKSINGLSVLVEQDMGISPFDNTLFVFCNKRRDKLKILYWDHSGFCLWYKRLEQERFKWPAKHTEDKVILTEEQLHWLLRGFDISRMQPHEVLSYRSAC
jgi:transposase